MTRAKLHISNAEYASSRTRLDALHKIVIDGNEAESVIKYADQFVDELGANLLVDIANGKQDIEEQIMAYKIAVQFSKKIKSIASQGKQKEAILQSLQK